MKQYFERKTDEDHSITGNKLIDILATYGIKAERKTIYDDIKTLIIWAQGPFRTRSFLYW